MLWKRTACVQVRKGYIIAHPRSGRDLSLENLLSVKQAREILTGTLTKPVDIITVELDGAFNCILAEDIFAANDYPQFQNSAMDGYAIRVSDVVQAGPDHPITLEVIGDIPAGIFPKFKIKPGQAARIMTAAPISEECDAVVPVENTIQGSFTKSPYSQNVVQVIHPSRPGEYIRPQGQDLKFGMCVLVKGSRLKAQHIGLLASLGIPAVKVFRPIRAALFSSGDELIPVDAPISPGKIYDSNTYTLRNLLVEIGVQVINLGISSDDQASMKEKFAEAINKDVDLIISSAGVSVGAFDYIRDVVSESGNINFWRVNMRPGKPVACGNYCGIHFIGLPGNPVSAYVVFNVLIKPAVLVMAGLTLAGSYTLSAITCQPIESDGRESYLRARVTSSNGNLLAELVGHQGSGNLFSLVQANALLIVPSGVKSLPAGSSLEVLLLE